jgi:hypothetical protein
MPPLPNCALPVAILVMASDDPRPIWIVTSSPSRAKIPWRVATYGKVSSPDGNQSST